MVNFQTIFKGTQNLVKLHITHLKVSLILLSFSQNSKFKNLNFIRIKHTKKNTKTRSIYPISSLNINFRKNREIIW